MTVTIGNTLPSIWKRIKMQYLATACGLAIAIGAFVGVVAWQHEGSTTKVSPRSVAVDAAPAAPSAQPRTVFYMVDSLAEAENFYRAQAASLQNGQAPTTIAIPVVVASDEQAQQMQQAYFYAGQATGSQPAFSVVDLRGR